jgi:hypothetical protein
MRSVLLLAFLLALASPAAAGEAEQFLNICALQQDRADCEKNSQEFTKWYGAALKGDYTSQRNVAYSFANGHTHALQRDFVQGCAWRLVIIASGSAKVDSGDAGNMQVDCGRLSAPELARAKARAMGIGRTIAADGEPRPAPAARGNKPVKELDATAYPL